MSAKFPKGFPSAVRIWRLNMVKKPSPHSRTIDSLDLMFPDVVTEGKNIAFPDEFLNGLGDAHPVPRTARSGNSVCSNIVRPALGLLRLGSGS